MKSQLILAVYFSHGCVERGQNSVVFSLQLFFPPFRVMDHSDTNRMTTQNIGIVFGPTLLRHERDIASLIEDMVYQNQVVEMLLTEFASIFETGAEWLCWYLFLDMDCFILKTYGITDNLFLKQALVRWTSLHQSQHRRLTSFSGLCFVRKDGSLHLPSSRFF